MTRQEEILKGFNESWGQSGINVSSNTANPSNGVTVNNPNGIGRAVELNFIDGINATRLTAAQIAALPNPQAGQIVYQTTAPTGLYSYDGSSWVSVGGSTTVYGTTNRISVTGGDTIDIASTYVGQTSITTLGTITTGTWDAIIGQATITLGSDATGDIYYRNASGKLTRLGIGSSGQVLGVNAGIPAWQAAGGGITVGTTTITSGTSGRIAFNSSGVYGESANLFWDNTNKRLGIGTSSPAIDIDVIGSPTAYLRLSNSGGNSVHLFNNNINTYLRHMVGVSVASEISMGNGTITLFSTTNTISGNLVCSNSSGTFISNLANSRLVGIGGVTPSAFLTIAAGTATANTAPLKLTAGTNLTTPENGAFEFDGTNLYFTVGGVRKTVTLV